MNKKLLFSLLALSLLAVGASADEVNGIGENADDITLENTYHAITTSNVFKYGWNAFFGGLGLWFVASGFGIIGENKNVKKGFLGLGSLVTAVSQTGIVAWAKKQIFGSTTN